MASKDDTNEGIISSSIHFDDGAVVCEGKQKVILLIQYSPIIVN